MPKKFRVMTPEELEADKLHRARLTACTDASLTAAMDAIERGASQEEVNRAAQESREQVYPDLFGRPSGGAWQGVALDALPRLSGDGWTAEAQRAFLVHLAQNGCVSLACAHVGLSRQSAYALRRRAGNSVFAICWDVAIHIARQALLDEATERAFHGREVPVWYHGEQVGTRIVHNDRLLMFLLGMKREPLHHALEPREMTHLFPAMLKAVDAILPPAIGPERMAELMGSEAGRGGENG